MVGDFEFVKDKNSMFYSFYSYNKESVDKTVKFVTKLNNFLKEKDISMVFAKLPSRIFENGISGLDIPTMGVINEMIDEVEQLEKNGIEFIDIRDPIKNGEYSKKEVFYRTDRQPKMEFGFCLVEYLAEYLEKTVA